MTDYTPEQLREKEQRCVRGQHGLPIQEQWDLLLAFASALEELERFKIALAYVAHQLHATPQHMLCAGVQLIDGRGARVSINGWTVSGIYPDGLPWPKQRAEAELSRLKAPVEVEGIVKRMKEEELNLDRCAAGMAYRVPLFTNDGDTLKEIIALIERQSAQLAEANDSKRILGEELNRVQGVLAEALHGDTDALICDLDAARQELTIAAPAQARALAERAWIRVRRQQQQLAERDGEIARLNKWADGMTNAALKERQTGEEYQRELRRQLSERDAELAWVKKDRLSANLALIKKDAELAEAVAARDGYHKGLINCTEEVASRGRALDEERKHAEAMHGWLSYGRPEHDLPGCVRAYRSYRGQNDAPLDIPRFLRKGTD